MKKIFYLLAISALPFSAFSQEYRTIKNDADYNQPFSTDIKISPNPGIGVVQVLFSTPGIYTNMVAYDNSGRQVYVQEHFTSNPVRVDMSKLQAGIYFAVFYSDNKQERITQRITIVK